MEIDFFSFPIELYIKLPPKILLNLSGTHPRFASPAIKALFEQTSQEAVDCQVNLMQLWCQSGLENRSQLCDESIIFKALSNKQIVNKTPGLLILALKQKATIPILSDQQFTSLLEEAQNKALDTSNTLFHLIPVMSAHQIRLLSDKIIKEIARYMVQLTVPENNAELTPDQCTNIQKKIIKLSSFLSAETIEDYTDTLLTKLNAGQETTKVNRTLLSTLGFLLNSNSMNREKKEQCISQFIAQPIPPDVLGFAAHLYLKFMSSEQRTDYVKNVMIFVEDKNSRLDSSSLLECFQSIVEYMSKEQKIKSIPLINPPHLTQELTIAKLKTLSFFSDVMNEHELKRYLRNVITTLRNAKGQNATDLRHILKLHSKYAGVFDYLAEEKIHFISAGTNQLNQIGDLEDLSLISSLISAEKKEEIAKQLFNLLDITPVLTPSVIAVLSLYFNDLNPVAKDLFVGEINKRLKDDNPHKNQIALLFNKIADKLLREGKRANLTYINRLIEQLDSKEQEQAENALTEFVKYNFLKAMSPEQDSLFLIKAMSVLNRWSKNSYLCATVILELSNLLLNNKSPDLLQDFEVHKSEIIKRLLACADKGDGFARTIVAPAHHLFSLMHDKEQQIYIDAVLGHMDEDEVPYLLNIFHDYLIKKISEGKGIDLKNIINAFNAPATLPSNRKMLLQVLEGILISIHYNVINSKEEEHQLWLDASNSLTKYLNEAHLNERPESIELQMVFSLCATVFPDNKEVPQDNLSSP